MSADQTAQDYWNRIMSRVPTVLGQLAYSAQLRQPVTGEYRHDGFAQLYGDEIANHALANHHLQVFRGWLTLPLSDQRADLMLFLSEVAARHELTRYWQQEEGYRVLIPTGASRAEQELFVTDLQALVAFEEFSAA
jgi:hypothetical protein